MLNPCMLCPDSEDSLSLTSLFLLFPPVDSLQFSSSFALGIRLTSIYMLRCWGDATPWDFFTAFPAHLLSPSSSPMSFLYFFEHLKLRVNLFLHVANKPTRAYRVSSIVNYRLPCDL